MALARSPDAANIRLELASMLVAAGKADEVPKLYEPLTLSRDDARVAQILLNEARYGEARALLERLVDRYSDDAGLYTMLGASCMGIGDGRAGWEHFSRAMALDSEWPELHYQLGMAALAERRIVEAVDHLSDAVRLAPDAALYRYNLAVATFMAGRPRDALPHIREAIRLNPADADTHGFCGVVLRELGDFAGADAAEAEARRLLPR
jgi:Flp pilus assembly protein TadD